MLELHVLYNETGFNEQWVYGQQFLTHKTGWYDKWIKYDVVLQHDGDDKIARMAGITNSVIVVFMDKIHDKHSF